jgi:starch synthase
VLKVLLCASEVAPVIKLGGLGDVLGSLPKSLEKLGVDADVVVPFFSSAKVVGLKIYKSLELSVPFGDSTYQVEVWATKLPASNVDLYLLKNDVFFGSVGKSAFLGNLSETQAFSFFSRCVAELIKGRFNTYDVIHCNDWHTGLVTHLLQDELGISRPATIMTIHNISYQGLGDVAVAREVGLDPAVHKTISWDISDGDLNLLMQGIMACDFITTVSPSYVTELLALDDGSQIQDVLISRQDRFLGILNGLDYASFPRTITKENWQPQKQSDKGELLKELTLTENDAPIFSMVSRLDPNQKGLDILSEVVPYIVQNGGKFVLLGSGDKAWEEKFRQLQTKLGLQNVSITTAFDAELAGRIYKGSDFFLIPSKFEPCGLTQMIAMWYGAVPVAHATGGLKDTIKHGKTGFLFTEYSAEAFKTCLTKCFNVYKSPAHFAIVEACLSQDFSFDKSAQSYKELYDKAVQIRKDAYGSVYL